MKLFTKTAVLAAGVSLVSLAAHASFTDNDIYLGFNATTSTSEYLVDLGQPGTIGVGGSSSVNLSSYVSLFGTAFTSGYNGVSMGVVGGNSSGFNQANYDIFATALRVGGAGVPSSPGSDLSSFTPGAGTIANSIATLTAIGFPTSGNGVIGDSSSTTSWTKKVSPTLDAGSFYGNSGVDPSSAIDGSGVLYEDFWKATTGNSYTYLGYFSLDVSGGSPSLSFTPAAVPEPASGALFCLAGLAWFFALRMFNRKSTASV
jgi:hypothetical protein